MVQPVQGQRGQGFARRDHFYTTVLVGPIDIERSSVMIPATLIVEKVFQLFRTFPMGREERRSGGIPLAEHEREVVGIPVRPAGGV